MSFQIAPLAESQSWRLDKPQTNGFKIRLLSRQEWANVISEFQDLSLMQTWEFGEAKSRVGPWRVERGIFYQGDQVVGAAQAFLRTVGRLNRGLVWINRGPLWRRSGVENTSTLIEMLHALRLYWAEQRKMYLRIALPVSPTLIEARALEQVGYHGTGVSGWASARVDLEASIDDLRYRLGKKWRQPLQKAERSGLEIACGSENSLFHDFLSRYQRLLAKRQLATSVTAELLLELRNVSQNNRFLVLTARLGGHTVGSVVIVGYGSTAEYLAAVIEEEGRRAGAGQLLLWSAMCRAQSLGYRWFDLGGMSPGCTPSGILKFKSGLGGVPYQLADQLETHSGGLSNRLIQLAVRWSLARRKQM